MARMDSRLARMEEAEHARLDAELNALLRALSDAELETLAEKRRARDHFRGLLARGARRGE
jgi:hypothetical protein